MISFMPIPHYPRGKIPRYPFYRRLDVPQNLFGCGGEGAIFSPHREPNPNSPVAKLVDYSLY
jgi:hypothetical protein